MKTHVESTVKAAPRAVILAFERRFPGVGLDSFEACRISEGDVENRNTLVFFGYVDDLIRFGLVEPWMIPKKPKRRRDWRDDPDARLEHWRVTRHAEGFLRVQREVTDERPTTPALEAFGPDNWSEHGVAHNAKRPLWLVVDNTRTAT